MPHGALQVFVNELMVVAGALRLHEAQQVAMIALQAVVVEGVNGHGAKQVEAVNHAAHFAVGGGSHGGFVDLPLASDVAVEREPLAGLAKVCQQAVDAGLLVADQAVAVPAFDLLQGVVDGKVNGFAAGVFDYAEADRISVLRLDPYAGGDVFAIAAINIHFGFDGSRALFFSSVVN